MNGHIGLLSEEVNENGQLLVDFTEMRLEFECDNWKWKGDME